MDENGKTCSTRDKHQAFSIKIRDKFSTMQTKKEIILTMSEEKRQLQEKIAALLHQTAEDHHVAYKETDGVDPDWSLWYAGHLLEEGFDKMLDATLLKSDLIYLLVLVDKQQMSQAPGAHWENYYADFFVSRYVK
jgi:hypothetical protein